MSNRNLRRLSTLVTAQTMYHLKELAAMAGHRSTGKVIDELVKDHMMQLRMEGRGC